MGKGSLVRWSPRVSPGKVRRLYELEKSGLYDRDLLLDVGWGLHARCRDAFTVRRAVYEGELPCPRCGEPVRRPPRKTWVSGEAVPAGAPLFTCPACAAELTWTGCREALRRLPKCFQCGRTLTWQYADNRLRCGVCRKEWTWQAYRRSVKARVWLPCPSCGKRLRRPDGNAVSRRAPEEAECPECGALAVHAGGTLSCPHCGFESTWRAYRKRMVRRVGRLRCSACRHRFTWQSWRASYAEQCLLTGGGAEPLREFASAWERCKTPRRQMLLIDALLHAVHGQGALAPVLIEGDERSTKRLLDELAQAR